MASPNCRISSSMSSEGCKMSFLSPSMQKKYTEFSLIYPNKVYKSQNVALLHFD